MDVGTEAREGGGGWLYPLNPCLGNVNSPHGVMNDAMESRGEEPTVEELRGEEPTSSSSSRLRFNASYDVHNNKCRENVIKKNVRCNKIYHNLLTIVNEA